MAVAKKKGRARFLYVRALRDFHESISEKQTQNRADDSREFYLGEAIPQRNILRVFRISRTRSARFCVVRIC